MNIDRNKKNKNCGAPGSSIRRKRLNVASTIRNRKKDGFKAYDNRWGLTAVELRFHPRISHHSQ
jgi:hypothetical protein